MKKKYYVGLATTYHDPAVAIVDGNGEILFAEAAERPLQFKRAINCEPDSLFRIGNLLEEFCCDRSEFIIARNWRRKRPLYETVSHLLGYFSPEGLRRRGYRSHITFLERYKIFHMLACQANAMKKGGLNLVRRLNERFPASDVRLVDFDHHLTHAAAACYTSRFEKAACMIVDSYGERGSVAFYRFDRGKISLLKELQGIESLGFFYMKLTELCGFDWLQGEEWKVMGLAPYGRPDEEIYSLLEPMLTVDGLGLRQNLSAIDKGLALLTRRKAAADWSAADMAHTGQYRFGEILGELIKTFHQLCPLDDLAMAGGCTLNSAFCGRILTETPFRRLHIPSAPADDGTALGAALLAYHADHPDFEPRPDIVSPFLGSGISFTTLRRLIRHGGWRVEHLPDTLCRTVAELLASGKLIGWFQGQAEFGPRALGNRSILADPRRADMKDRINALVKFREEFRPFAPAILHEFGEDYFDPYQESPYMERTLPFRPEVREKVPAVVHVDGTGRLQTVKRAWNPRFHELIAAFHGLTGIPLLLNTSLNVMGKPIVHSLEDAVAVFATSGLDALVIEDYLFLKPGIPS